MNDQQFELAMCELEDKGSWHSKGLRARDTAQREALARVEAERDEFKRLARENFELVGDQRQSIDTAQAQLAQAVGLLRELRPTIPKDVLLLWCIDRDAFLSRHAQAEQQEAHGAQAVDAKKTKIDWVNDYRVRHGVSLRVAAKAYEARAALATQPAGYHHMVEAVDFLEAAADAYERGYQDGRSRPKGYSDKLAKHRVAAELLAAVRGAEHE